MSDHPLPDQSRGCRSEAASETDCSWSTRKKETKWVKMSIGFFFLFRLLLQSKQSKRRCLWGQGSLVICTNKSRSWQSRVPEKETILTLFRLKPTYSSTHLKMYTNLKSKEWKNYSSRTTREQVIFFPLPPLQLLWMGGLFVQLGHLASRVGERT